MADEGGFVVPERIARGLENIGKNGNPSSITGVIAVIDCHECAFCTANHGVCGQAV